MRLQTASGLLALLLLSSSLPAAAQTPASPGTAADASAARAKPALRVLSTGGLRVESAALLLSDQEGGTIPFAVLAVPFPGDGDRVRVPVIVEIDGTDLLAGHDVRLLQMEVSLYALGGGGSVLGSRMDTVEVDLDRLGTSVGESGIRYVGELSLPPDSYWIRILVRNLKTGELGLSTAHVKIPSFKKSSGILLPPAFADPGPDLWVQARAAGSTALTALAPADPPSARPILAPDSEASLVIAGWKLPSENLRVQLFRNFIVDKAERQEKVADLPVRIVNRRQGPGDLQIFDATFKTETIDSGEYDIRLAYPRSAADLRTDDLSLSTRIVLVSEGARGSVWATLNSGGRQPEGQEARRAESAPDRRRKPRAGPVRQSYREALALLAAGDATAAAAAVGKLENSLLTGKGRYSSEDVVEIEVGVAQDLAKTSPEGLEPIFALHQRLYREAQAARQYLLATHAREVALQLTDVYAASHATPAGKARAASFVLGLAADMLKTAPAGLRERTYQRVLALDEKNAIALLCQAVDHERQGKYQDAADTLERLVRFHPGHAEGRLRLGINRVRLGRPRDGQQLLQELAADGGVDPRHALLARQELVRILLAQNAFAEAESMVREGLARHPEDEKLTLQLSMLQDLRRDSRGARETLEPMAARKNPAEPVTARNRYNSLPIEQLEAIRDDLARTTTEQNAALAAALGKVGNDAP
jgi:tetratricopeptide (TPR) repeat protein